MNTRQLHRAWLDKALHSCKAEFLKVDDTHALVKTPPKDKSPLQRSLKRPSDAAVQTNEELCVALWQLNVRN
jgi:hypothetical protein